MTTPNKEAEFEALLKELEVSPAYHGLIGLTIEYIEKLLALHSTAIQRAEEIAFIRGKLEAFQEADIDLESTGDPRRFEYETDLMVKALRRLTARKKGEGGRHITMTIFPEELKKILDNHHYSGDDISPACAALAGDECTCGLNNEIPAIMDLIDNRIIGKNKAEEGYDGESGEGYIDYDARVQNDLRASQRRVLRGEES